MAPPTTPIEQRLRRKLRLGPGGCWIYTGARNEKGYGKFAVARGVTRLAHVVAYELWVGEIPPGHELHHDCERKMCCNPAHLILLTRAEHSAIHRHEFCKNGHPLFGENLYEKSGRRGCKECRRANWRDYYRRQRQKRK